MSNEKVEQLKWDIVCTGNDVAISDTTVKIQELYGGFGQGQKILTVPQIALLHVDDPNNKEEVKKRIKRINELINENIQGFTYKVDIIDLKRYKIDFTKLKQFYIYSQAQIGNSNNLYILSLSGYCKLYNTMRIKDNILKEKIIKEYFQQEVYYDDSVVYKEIDFKNTYEKRINIILDNVLKTSWNIDELSLKNIIKNNHHIPKHQYSVCNNKYQIDFYFEKFRIIVEYDETRHKYRIEEDKKRIDEIIQFLSLKDGDCGFNSDGVLCDLNDIPIDSNNCDYYILRIKESDDEGLDKLIGIVLGKIFSLC
jgi:hypothetical protein